MQQQVFKDGTAAVTNGNSTEVVRVLFDQAMAERLTGSATLYGRVILTSGTIQNLTADIKLYYGNLSKINNLAIVSDTANTIQLVNSTGGSSTDLLGTTGLSFVFELELANESWWKLAPGMDLSFSGTTGTFVATLEAYVLSGRR